MISFELAVGTVSFVSLVAVSIDRYLAICYPIEYYRIVGPKTTIFAVTLCWLYGVIGILPALGWKSKESNNRCDPQDVLAPSYLIVFFIIVATIPTIILAMASYLTCKKIAEKVRLRCDQLQDKIQILLMNLMVYRPSFKQIQLSVGRETQRNIYRMISKSFRPQRRYG